MACFVGPGGGGILIHSCVVVLKQAITDPPLNTDILNIKLWPLIIDIHSFTALTYRNNPYNSRKIFNWEVRQKCLQNSGKYSTTVEFYAFEVHTLNDNMRLLKRILFSNISWNWYPKRLGSKSIKSTSTLATFSDDIIEGSCCEICPSFMIIYYFAQLSQSQQYSTV